MKIDLTDNPAKQVEDWIKEYFDFIQSLHRAVFLVGKSQEEKFRREVRTYKSNYGWLEVTAHEWSDTWNVRTGKSYVERSIVVSYKGYVVARMRWRDNSPVMLSKDYTPYVRPGDWMSIGEEIIAMGNKAQEKNKQEEKTAIMNQYRDLLIPDIDL